MSKQHSWATGFAMATAIMFTAEPLSAAERLPFSILPASIIRNSSIDLTAEAAPKAKRWVGLVCAPHGCELRPVRLTKTTPKNGTGVRFSYVPPAKHKIAKREYTIALLGGLHEGQSKTEVPTWFTLRSLRRTEDAASGSLGVTINTPTTGEYCLVPRWNQTERMLNLYLETQTQRQLLGHIALESVNAGLKPRDILVWAGDIDNDGKLDLITRVTPDNTISGLHLWLSSRASNGEFVGIGASLDGWEDIDEAAGC